MPNAIGIKNSNAEELAAKLNVLLAHYLIFCQNTRGYYWNIKGDNFFELHLKFEELYNDLILKRNEVAEQILTLGHSPEFKYSVYNKSSAIKGSALVSEGKKAVENVLGSFKTIIKLQREILILSEDANDEGTNALIRDYIRFQEKQVWMYSSFLEK